MRDLLRGWVEAGIAAVLGVAVLTPPSGASAAALETVYSFCSQGGCADGASPVAGLIMDAAGHLYGTTNGGGAHGQGTVFELTPAGLETVLYSFCPQNGCADGEEPAAGLIMDKSGKLYGTTRYGGTHSGGTVFELAPNAARTSWTETVLYSFCVQTKCADGATPVAGLIVDTSGNLYGTTLYGGSNCSSGVPAGCGTVFELSRIAGRWKHTILYSFCAQAGCPDGVSVEAGLIMDTAGRLYGTTAFGGTGDNGGAVFALTPNAAKTKWTETLLYSFAPFGVVNDGVTPLAGLLMDASGRLYGTASQGGAHKNGTVFELTPNAAKTKWKESVLYSFCVATNCADGAGPAAGVVMDASGKIYGTTKFGGTTTGDGSGTVFQLAPNATGTKWTETVLHSFCSESQCADGATPVAGLTMDASGRHFFGTNPSGAHDAGTVFEVAR